MIAWLELHHELAGWAQFIGAVVALFVTYISAFGPIWRRRRHLEEEGQRLLMNGYEVIASYHRAVQNFAPFPLSLEQGALPMTAVIDDMSRFPVYELVGNSRSMSIARRLMTMRMTLDASRHFLLRSAEGLDGAVDDQTHMAIRSFIEERLAFAHNLLMNVHMSPVEWPAGDGGHRPTNGR